MLRSIILVLCASLISAPATACTLAKVGGSDAQINPNRIDSKLMSQSILAHTNLARCKKRRKPLEYSRNLTKAADGHAEWMGKTRTLSHTSTKSGQQKLQHRLKRARAPYRAAAENIASTNRMAFPRGASFGIKDRASCQFTDKSGNLIPAHTYDSLARQLVADWTASSGHNKNMMNKAYGKMGGSVAFDPKGKNCGTYFGIQVFTD